MERLNEILVELKKIEDDPFNAEKIDKMAKLNKEKNDLFAKYIEESGIDVFFDANDENLNNPAVLKNPALVTKAINDALSKSTHMIAVISNNTKEALRP